MTFATITHGEPLTTVALVALMLRSPGANERPPASVIVRPPQLVVLTKAGLPATRFAGKLSVTVTPVRLLELPGLVIVSVSVVWAPGEMGLAPKAFETVAG